MSNGMSGKLCGSLDFRWKLRFLRVCREFEGASFPEKTDNYLPAINR